MKRVQTLQKQRKLRTGRTKAQILKSGKKRSRLVVSRTNKHIYLQIIDDIKQVTLASVSDKDVKVKNKKRVEIAKELGGMIAGKAKENKIKEVVLDRRRFRYHGIVKAVAEGAREGGLVF